MGTEAESVGKVKNRLLKLLTSRNKVYVLSFLPSVLMTQWDSVTLTLSTSFTGNAWLIMTFADTRREHVTF